MRRFMIGSVLLLALLLVPTAGHAAPPQDGGCATLQIGVGNNCRYFSHGPGAYAVTTLSGFRIQACPPGSYDVITGICGAQWRFLAGAAPTPTAGARALAGPLDTVDGEVIDVSISIVEIRHPEDDSVVLRYQDGAITAHDLPA